VIEIALRYLIKGRILAPPTSPSQQGPGDGVGQSRGYGAGPVRVHDNKAQRGEPEIVTTHPDPLLTAGHGNAEANCRTSVWRRERSCSGC